MPSRLPLGSPLHPIAPVPVDYRMAGGGGKGGKGGKEGVMDGSQNKPVETALFGVLFTLSKEKANDNVKVALLTILVDFFLIMAVMLTTEYPYYTDTKLW